MHFPQKANLSCEEQSWVINLPSFDIGFYLYNFCNIWYKSYNNFGQPRNKLAYFLQPKLLQNKISTLGLRQNSKLLNKKKTTKRTLTTHEHIFSDITISNTMNHFSVLLLTLLRVDTYVQLKERPFPCVHKSLAYMHKSLVYSCINLRFMS